MRIKYVIQILVIFAFLVLPKNIVFGVDDRNYYYNLGLAYYFKGDLDGAIDAWEKVASVDRAFK